MKKILFFLLLGVLFFQCTPKITDAVGDATDTVKDVVEDVTTTATNQETFRHSAPTPGAAPVIKVKDAANFTLDNGLKIIVAENNKLPVVSFQVFVDVPPLMEKDQAGAASIAGDLLSRGTTTKTKSEIDESVDFIGADFSSFSSGLYASSLKKHTETLMALASDVLLNPSFPKEEFEKIKTQTLSGLASNKDDPNAIASNVSSVLNYGKDHPYGEIVTEETVGNITLQSAKNYYNTYMKPNIGYVIIVGDISAAEAKPLAEKYFGGWGKGTVAKKEFAMPKAPAKTQVDFVSKSGAVQSVINVTYPVDLKPGTDDVIQGRVLNTIIGGYFGSRLMQNLREDKAYTYGARSRLSYDPHVGVFNANASVRNEVTQGSIQEFLNEMNRLRTEKVSEKELTSVKNFITGSFARSLEDGQTVARFARNIARYNLPADYYATYLEKLNAVTADDIMAMAQKYLKPDNAHILVVGNKGEVAESLSEFGEINYYDTYGNQLVIEEGVADANITADMVIDKYISAIGGKEKLMAVKDISINMGAEMMGQAVEMTLIQKAPNKIVSKLTTQGMTIQESIFDGTKGKQGQMGQSAAMSPEDIKTIKKQATLFPEMKLKEMGNTLKLVGTEQVDGKNAYVIEITDADGKKVTNFFDTESHLKIREINVIEAGEQTITLTNDLLDYKPVDGILFPHTRTTSGATPAPLTMKVTEIKVNSGVEDSVFSIE